MNRTCVIISPYFPPSTLAGVHRARHLAKHLPDNGWTPIVVAVDESFYEERLDWDLASLVPSHVEIVKVRAVPQRYCRPFGLGEISLRAWYPLRAAVNELLSTRDIDVVLISGSPYYPMLMTPTIKRRFDVAVVHDFQDPWVSHRGELLPRWSKGWLSHRLSLALEPTAVKSPDFITSVSEQQNNELADRYPWLDKSRMAAIPIGGDPEDYANLGIRDVKKSQSQGCFHFVYAGTIWPPAIDTLRTLLKAVSRVRDWAPDLYERIRLDFVGTTANPNNYQDCRVLPIAQEEGVANIVTEIPQRLPYLEALAIQANANVILALGSSEAHYTASKIFGILMSGRPYLSLFHSKSSAHEIMSRAGAGISLTFDSTEALSERIPTLAHAIIHLVTNPNAHPVADPSTYSAYTAQATAEQFARVFERVV